VARNPDDLPAVLTDLLGGAEVRWRPDRPATDNPNALWLDDPTGGGYLLSRESVPFTPAESARAHALIELARAIGAAQPPAPPAIWWMLLPGGEDVAVRRATADDLDAVVDLHARCSLTSRLRRYLAGTNCPSHEILARLLDPEHGYSLVAEDRAGRVIALANLMWTDDGAELALLVEDAWQRRRIGTALARRLLVAAREAELATVRSTVHAGNGAMIRIMAGLGRRLHREYEGGMLTLIAHLDSPPPDRAGRWPSDPAVAQPEVLPPVVVGDRLCRVERPEVPEAEGDGYHVDRGEDGAVEAAVLLRDGQRGPGSTHAR